MYSSVRKFLEFPASFGGFSGSSFANAWTDQCDAVAGIYQNLENVFSSLEKWKQDQARYVVFNVDNWEEFLSDKMKSVQDYEAAFGLAKTKKRESEMLPEVHRSM